MRIVGIMPTDGFVLMDSWWWLVVGVDVPSRWRFARAVVIGGSADAASGDLAYPVDVVSASDSVSDSVGSV